MGGRAGHEIPVLQYVRKAPRTGLFAKRIQHFIKVHSFSKLIGEKEGLDAHTLFVLEAASILHDIGIRVSEEKYGFQNGKLQEQEGPAPAREICTSLGFKEDDIESNETKFGLAACR